VSAALLSSRHTLASSGTPPDSRSALTSVGGLPISFYYGVVLVAGFAYLMAFTPLGRHMRFTGASREVSRLSGVRVNRIRFGSFVAAAALSGVGAVIAVTISTLLRRRTA
jgi:ribose transport system permease protein